MHNYILYFRLYIVCVLYSFFHYIYDVRNSLRIKAPHLKKHKNNLNPLFMWRFGLHLVSKVLCSSINQMANGTNKRNGSRK